MNLSELFFKDSIKFEDLPPITTSEQLNSDPMFRAVWWNTEGIPGSFTRLNAAKYYELAWRVGRNAHIVEVGVDQGRSASVIAAVAEKTGARITLVDNWRSALIANKAKTERNLEPFVQAGVQIEVLHMDSEKAAQGVVDGIDLLHIDAHHYSPSIDTDCTVWLPKLKPGGVVCFHDYAATFEDVTRVVDRETGGWEDLGVWDSLAVRRKP